MTDTRTVVAECYECLDCTKCAVDGDHKDACTEAPRRLITTADVAWHKSQLHDVREVTHG